MLGFKIKIFNIVNTSADECDLHLQITIKLSKLDV